jgi:hypothetical protein
VLPADVTARGWALLEKAGLLRAAGSSRCMCVISAARHDRRAASDPKVDTASYLPAIVGTREGDAQKVLSGWVSTTAHTFGPATLSRGLDRFISLMLGQVQVIKITIFKAAFAKSSVSSPGNFSALNNAAAGEATGPIIGLLNNDLEVEESGWLDEMVSLASRPEVECVGCGASNEQIKRSPDVLAQTMEGGMVANR